LTDAMPLKLGYPHEWMAINMPSTFGKAEFEPRCTERLASIDRRTLGRQE
jgi:hypothetical protein